MKKTLTTQHKANISKSMKSHWETRATKNTIELSHNTQAVKKPSLVSSAKRRDLANNHFLNLTAEMIRSILDSTENGDLETWMEFTSVIVEQDPHLRGLIEKRRGSISSKELKIIPTDATNTQAVAAADFCRTVIEEIPRFDNALRHLMMAVFSGVAATEIIWERKDFEKYPRAWAPSSLISIPGKRLGISEIEGQWEYILSSYGEFLGDKTNPFIKKKSKFIVHSPDACDVPHFRGILRSLAFIYLFKKLSMVYWLGGAEKNAFPAIYASVPSQTPDHIRNTLLQNLDSLSSDGVGVINSDVAIEVINASSQGGDLTYRSIMSYLDTVITKIILGGTLAVEATSGAGGNRALGEVHERSAQEIIDGDARNISETIREDLIKPLLELNLHVFGGKMPPIPKVIFDVANRAPAQIGQIHVQAQAVTINEIRKQLGLASTSWGEERAIFNGATAQPQQSFQPQNGQANSKFQVK